MSYLLQQLKDPKEDNNFPVVFFPVYFHASCFSKLYGLLARKVDCRIVSSINSFPSFRILLRVFRKKHSGSRLNPPTKKNPAENHPLLKQDLFFKNPEKKNTRFLTEGGLAWGYSWVDWEKPSIPLRVLNRGASCCRRPNLGPDDINIWRDTVSRNVAFKKARVRGRIRLGLTV